MTTTTTSNLNLEKPDVGSEANNWGNIINSSLDDVDKAIAQRLVKPVGGSSDVTLTLTDSKFAVIEFTGTLSGNISVKTYANDAKPYIVFNNTSGSFSLTFKTNTGGGVVITQGQKTIVYSDGTNMVSAVDTSQLSVSRTITLSGDVTGSVATNLSTNPTITTAIGSGVIVNADVNASAAIDASKIADGTVSNTEFQRLDGVSSDIQTQLDGLRHNADDVKIKFGAGDDLEIFHDTSGGGTDNIIQATNTSHSLRLKSDSILLQGANGNALASFSNGGSANLSYSNTNRLSTTGTGVAVTGELTATGNITSSGNVNGNGQNLTNLNAANLTGTLPAIDGSNLTGISSAPSTGTSVGALKYFALYYKGSGGASNSISIGVGAEITPSSYESSNMYVTSTGLEYKRNQGTQGQLNTSTLSYLLPGFASTSTIQGQSRATESGTWRCISQATYSQFSTTGQNGGTYTVSGGGLFQRVS